MRPRRTIVVTAVFVGLLLLAILLTVYQSGAHRSVSVGFMITKGHFPEPAQIIADQVAVLSVTNTGRCAITLVDPYVQFENTAGRLIEDHGSSWNQNGYSLSLPPGSAAWLANGFDRDRKRLRFFFEYRRDGGPLLRGISKVCGALPLKALPQQTYDCLRRNGMVDGTTLGRYESPWIANETVQRTGASGSAHETNRTSSAAGSGR